jgi:hypothetical protein
VHGDVAVEIAIRKIEMRLAVTCNGVDVRESLADLRSHVLPKLDSCVVRLLLGGQAFIVEVLAQSCANLDRSLETRTGVVCRKLMVR